MTDNNSLTLFDQLATEIIFEIFDYLSCNDILYTFFDFNQRFHSILLQHQQFSYYFKSPLTNFYVWNNILSNIGSQIQHLTITTVDFDFSLKLFPNIKFLILSSPFSFDYERLYSIFNSKQFQNLISFQLKSEIFHKINHYGDLEKCLFKNLFNHENSLQLFESSSKLHLSFFNYNSNISINKNIHSISLRLTTFIDIIPLFDYTPNLKCLNLIITSFYIHNESREQLYSSKINLEKFSFTHETDTFHFGTFEEYLIPLTKFIKQFSSSLIYLSIDLSRLHIVNTQANDFNGILLQRELLESMIELKTFHFYTRLYNESLNNKHLLSTFENQFWFDHHWSIGIHGKYLYTLPFHFDKLNDFIDFNNIKTNNLMILNSPHAWHHVISIHFSVFYILNFNLIQQIKLKMPKLRTIIFNTIINQCFSTVEDSDKINLTLDSLNTVYFNGSYMNDIQPFLTDILPNLKELVLCDQNKFVPVVEEKIERLKIINVNFLQCIGINDTYFPNVKHIEIKIDHCGPYDVRRILNNFKNLKTFTLYFRSFGYDSDSPEGIDTMDKVNLMEILKDYQIKRSFDCYQLIKKKIND